jgi:WD40 repeat protein
MHLVCSSDDGRILVWDLSKVGEQEPLTAKWLACPSDQRFVFESEEEEEQYGNPSLLEWNKDGSFLAAAQENVLNFWQLCVCEH